jgi:hypothetical protein
MGLPFSIPPLNFAAPSTAAQDTSGSGFSLGDGDWVVNLGGSGTALQAASGGMSWLLIAAAAGAAWLLIRK